MESLRRFIEVLDAGLLRHSLAEPAVRDGLHQLHKALKVVVNRNKGSDLQDWPSYQLDPLVSILNALLCSSGNLPSAEDGTIVKVFTLTVQLCIKSLECFALKSKIGPTEEQVQERFLHLLEAATLDGKAERASNHSSLRDLSPDFLLETAASFDDIEAEEGPAHQQDGAESSHDILAVLVNEQLLGRKGLGAGTGISGRQSFVTFAQQYAVAHSDCIPRLLAACNSLLGKQGADLEVDRRIALCTRILVYLVDLRRATVSYRTPLENAVVEVGKVASSLIKILKQSRDAGNIQNEDREASIGSLPLLCDSLLQLSEALSPGQSLSQNLRTFFAASILEKMDSSKTWQEGHLGVACTPQLVNYFLRLLQADQYHVEGRRGYIEHITGDKSDLGQECQLKRHCFSLNEIRSRTEHLQAVFPSDEDWLGNLIAVAASLHTQGMKMRPAVDVASSVHSEEDSVTISMDSMNMASEDDALFGDLFSECGRHSVTSEEAPVQAPSSKKVVGVQEILLRTTCEVLSFLKSYIFFPDWHRPTFEAARSHLSKERLDCVLHLHSQTGKQARASDSEAEQTSLAELHSTSFDLLFALVERGALPEVLQTHLFNQLLKQGDTQCSLPRNVVAMVGKLLVNRFQQGSTSNDPLVFELWRFFSESVVNKAKAPRLPEADKDKFTAGLPSWFYMEVLFMAFHSVDALGRLAIIQNLVTSLASCCVEKQAADSLVYWSLLISRLVLAVKYLLSHFSFFPRWLVLDLSKKLQYERVEIPSEAAANDGAFSSFAARFARYLLKQPRLQLQHTVEEQYIRHLVDVDLPSRDTCSLDLFAISSSDLKALITTLCSILESWTCKAVKQVDELILERHVFLLAWKLMQFLNREQLLPWEFSASTTTEFFFRFSGSICAGFKQQDTNNADQWAEFLVSSLSDFQISLGQGSVSLASWDHLRQGAMLALLLLPLQAGLDHIAEQEFMLYVQVVRRLFEDTELVRRLLEVLSSILEWYADAVGDCLLLALGQQSSSQDAISLVLRACLQQDKRQEYIEKAGADFNTLKLLLRWGSSGTWKGELTGVLATCNVRTEFLPALLHGFPLYPLAGNAALVSCMLSLEELLGVIANCIRHCAVPSVFDFGQLLKMIMAMKVNCTFDSLQPHYDAAFAALLPRKEDQALYNDVYLLKHMEDILKVASTSKAIPENLREEVLNQAVELFSNVKADSTRCPALSLRFCSYEEGHLRPELRSLCITPGCFAPFVDVLDGCLSDTANVKALQFFVDLLESSSGFRTVFRQQVQRKLISMEKEKLASWFEQRFLGCRADGSEGKTMHLSSSAASREAAARFMQAVVTSSTLDDLQGTNLKAHMLDALLLRLEHAFVQYDAPSARAYFSCAVQLANGEEFLENVTGAVMGVVSKVPTDAAHLDGLKCLLSFLSSVLVACGAQKHFSETRFDRSKKVPQSRALTNVKSRGTRRGCDQSLPVASDPGTAECDATSVDEDEDDATSDGELASLDKEDDEDSSNAERALAAKVCTFTSSGSNFMEQHWYFCYTCDLTVSKGCCSVCAKVCHRGHKVVYSRLSRFFCDCGAGGVRGVSCLCLKPRKYTPSGLSTGKPVSETRPEPLLAPSNHERLQLSDSDSDTDTDEYKDADETMELNVRDQEGRRLFSLLSERNLEEQLLSLSQRLLADAAFSGKDTGNDEIQLGQDKVLKFKNDIVQLKRAYKSGSLDMKIKAEYSNSRELKAHLLSGSLTKSLLTVSSRGRLAAGEGDKVTIFDVGQLIGQPTAMPVTVDKTTVKSLSKNSVRFELVQLVFNTVNENYLAVAGYEDCLVFTINPRGEVTDRLPVELALQDAHIRRVAWVPGSQVELMVVTNKFVKIFDLSVDKISPMHYFTVLEDQIVDAALLVVGQGQLLALVLSQRGVLYKEHIQHGSDSGARILTDVVQLPPRFRPVRGVSLHYSSCSKLLFASFNDGLSLLCRMDGDAALAEVSSVVEIEQEKSRPAGLHHWRDVFEGSSTFACLSSKPSSPTVVQLGTTDIHAQHLRLAGSLSALRVDGISSYRSMAKERSHVLILYEDGSLHVFSYLPSSTESTPVSDSQKQVSSLEAEQMKKLGAALLLSSRSPSPPVFPLDFFEKTMCITSDVKFGGDILRNTDSDGVKLSLASDDGFLESPSPAGFKIMVFNSNPDITMVGCRIHVGNTSTNHIPSEIRLSQRSVKLEEGVRCWYDIPFTNSEAFLADEEFSLTICSTFNGNSAPRIDNLEVYGRSKEDFGWKEKLDAVLDLENQREGASANLKGSKSRKLQSASALEQVFHEAFRVLCGFYSLSRLHSADFDAEKCKANCTIVLGEIFERDSQSLLQSAGRRVLRALSPTKDAYYQAKDMMALSGVARSCPSLALKVSLSGNRLRWVVQEFCSQVRTVCKISLHRPSNFATYLERNGPSIVNGLLSVLWDILLSEQLDAQTVNDLVVLTVDLIYGYSECLSVHLSSSVSPAVSLLQKLLFASYDTVRSSSSLAISSRLLQLPLPKQTMLSMDDGGENSRTASIHSETGTSTVVSGQAMLEEDPGTASVQYCCDGCSTVPIQRRRWHCNVCPDFDLCEACFEAMDGDQLPPPHTRDHPMSSIAIEADTAGDNHEIQFTSIDDMSEESLLQMATELSLQSTSASLTSALEAHDSCEFSDLVEIKSGSISASKSMVNSLLLGGLLDNIRGWTKSTSGTTAIPLMQLFYRIATASVESSGSGNLERLVKSLLDELSMETPLSVKSRSSFGEMVILIFMFFTLLVRYWHQPGSAHGQSKTGKEEMQESSECDRACSLLRQQSLISFLLNITQQLAQVFKSSFRAQETPPLTAPCGALLVVRREFAAGSFAPYFPDSYAKSHKGDLFAEFHKLMLESAFRLTYSLVRPGKSEKSSDKEQQSPAKGCPGTELRLDGWQDVLCGYINNPQTAFIRKYARRLLLHVCGSKTHYYTIRDGWQLSREVKKLYKLVQKSGGFQAVIPYERSVKILKSLTLIGEVASARPRNWQKYCSKHADVIPFLLNGAFCFVEELVVQTLKLLGLVFFYGKDASSSSKKEAEATGKAGGEAKKEKKAAAEDSDRGYFDMEQAVDQLVGEDEKNLKNFLDAFLLEWNAASVRSEAKTVLSGAWHHGGHAFRVLLLTLLLERIPLLPSYGQNVQEFNELLSWLLKKGTQEVAPTNQESVLIQGCLTANTIKKVFETLRLQNELLANHPNSRIYSTLATLVEFDGYYLESEPCLACSSPEVPYARMKLDNIKAETKFTDNRILVKCVGSHTIQSVTMNVHEPRRSKSIKTLNLYYNNRVVADLSELKNNMSLWKRAKICQLNFGQTELKVEFPIPITACNFMIELDGFYENLQAASLETLQCPRCSRLVTDKHGICSNCHENAYQCRQCRNINYENLDSFLCNECGYSKYGRFEFNFMAKPSYIFDRMENDEDMKKGLAAIEAESENAHKKYQQLLGYKKPLLKLVSSIGESEVDSQQKDSVQQMMVPVPGSSSFKINRKIAILGVLYGEKCKMAFDSVSKSVQTLQGLRRVLMAYLERKKSPGATSPANILAAQRHRNHCFGCANTFVGHCLEWLQILSKIQYCRQQLVGAGILAELFENNIHQGPKSARIQARSVLCAFTEGESGAVAELNSLIKQKVLYCLEHHRSMDIAACVRDEMQLLSETCSLGDEFWEARLRVVFQLLFRSIQVGARHPVIAEHIILPSLRIVSQACTPPKTDSHNGDSGVRAESRTEDPPKPTLMEETIQPPVSAKNQEKDADAVSKGQDLLLVNYAEWRNGATYVDFIRRQYTVTQAGRPAAQKRKDTRRGDSLALKYLLRWKRRACKHGLAEELKSFEDSSWVRELVLSACSQPIRQEMCLLIEVLCSQSLVRKSKFLDLLMALLPASRSAGESASEYFELLFKMVEPEDARLYLTVRGFLRTTCTLITEEVSRIEAQERSFRTDISQGYILNKLIELLNKFLHITTVRARFMKEGLLSQVLEALLVIRGLVVQKTKLISDCGRLLRELLDNLLEESHENKRHFIRACIAGLQAHHQSRNRRTLFVLEQLCNIICPTKPEPAYMLILNKAHTQEEFIRGSMTKNPYSSLEIGPLMRDVKNKICQQLELVGLLEDDFSMELLVAGNIISLDLSVALVYEQVWRKAHNQSANLGSSLLVSPGIHYNRECPPMTVTYRLQGLDGEATEPMIKELDDDREETQDPEVEFAITGVMDECGGLSVLLKIVQQFTDDELKSNQEQVSLVLKVLMCCCRIRANRQALLKLGALDLLLETGRRVFSASESVEALLLIVEQLVLEANESDVGVTENSRSPRGEQAAKGVLMFLDRLATTAASKQPKQHRNSETIARILPYLTFGEQTAMEVLLDHFMPYLQDWAAYDKLQKQALENPKDSAISQQAVQHQLALGSFIRMTESIKQNVFGDRLKDLIMERQIVTAATSYLKNVFRFGLNKDYKGSLEWSQALELASMPILLSILRGLSKGHRRTQQYLDSDGLLPLLHALEGVSGDNDVGARAESLLDTLVDKNEGFLTDKIMMLRDTTRDEMKRRALQRREELLQGLGMRRELRSDGGERIVISKPSIEGLEELEEEEAVLACMVCREGYKLRPTDMLGTYSYSKRVNVGPTGGRAEWVYTTVSHFNVIHFQCHLEAKRADASLKNPKKEWEGAAIRNNETLCNNLFPLRGPAVPLLQYTRCVDVFWDNLNTLGRADGSRLRLLTYDISLILGRFATGASFSADCKGGGKESNSRLLPFMIQMARHLLDQQGPSQRRVLAKSLQAYLSPAAVGAEPADREAEAATRSSSTSPPPGQRSTAGEETAQFMMLQSLLLHSYDEWKQHRKAFLRRGAAHAFMLHKQGRSLMPASTSASSPASRSNSGSSFDAAMLGLSPIAPAAAAAAAATETVSGEQLFSMLKPVLVYVGIVDQMQRFFKSSRGRGGAAAAATDGSSSGGGEPWEVTMKERLMDVSSLLAFAKELLEWLEEMQSSEELQEAVDVVGALGDALSGGFSSCEDFFLDAIGLSSSSSSS